MKAFVFRLLSDRPDFMTTMDDRDREVMAAHAAFWFERLTAGQVLAFGPVADPAGPYGLGIVVASDLAEAEAMRDQDPALTGDIGLRIEISPAVSMNTPGGSYR